MKIMIEDLQDEYLLYKQKKEPTSNKGKIILLMLIFWIIYSTIVIMTSLPSMKRALNQTNALEIFEKVNKYRTLVSSVEQTLFFCSQSNEVKPFSVLIHSSGSSNYHNAIEGLLSGPDNKALSEGFITFINKGTTLLGLTVSEKTAFVNLSQPVADSENEELAKKQILLTLQSINPYINRLVLMVNGNIVP